MCSQLNPLFADAYLKPQQTHNVQPVKTTPLFAVGYQKPQQTHNVQPVKQPRCSQSDTSSLIRLPMRSKLTPQLVRSRIPEATTDS
nr:hypothetical protein [Klebsiella pneumoniae]